MGSEEVLQDRQPSRPSPRTHPTAAGHGVQQHLALAHRQCPQTRAGEGDPHGPRGGAALGREGGLWGQSLAGQKVGMGRGQSLAVLAGLESEIEGWFASEV